MYSVDVNAGQHLTVVLDATEYNLYDYELYIRYGALPTTAIYDARGELPDADQAVEVATTQAGTYYVLVRSASGGGDYSLVAHTANTLPSLPVGTVRNGSLQGSSDVKVYQVVVPAGEHLTVVLDATEYNLYDYELYIRYGALPTTAIYDARGELPDADQAVEVANTQAETYYVLVRSASGGGNYTLVAHTGDTLPSLPVGTVRNGSLQGSSDVKVYQVVVPAGEHLTVVLDATEYNLYDYELYIRYGALPTTAIYDAKGELPDADQVVEVANTQAGTYYVLVRSRSGGGAYTLVAHTSGTFPTLALCDPRPGTLQGSSDVKFYQVVVPAGEHMTVVLDGSPDLYQYDLYIRYGALPTTVVYDDVGNGTGADQAVQVAPTQEGIYYLMIRSASGGGSYVIGVQGFCHRISLPMIVRDR